MILCRWTVGPTTMKKLFLLPITLGVVLGTAPLPAPAATNDWSFQITPYLWVAGVEIDASLPDQGGSGAERFDTRISAGAMVSAQARYRSAGLFLDSAWLRLHTDAVHPGPAYDSLSLRSDFIHSTAALTYQLPLEGRLQAELLAGARLWYVANEFEAGAGILPGFNADTDKTWVDPMVGASLQYDLGKGWAATVKGLVGGFGASADLAGEAFAGVLWRFSDHWSATLGYRYLREEYDRDNYEFTLDAQGFLLGLGVRF